LRIRKLLVAAWCSLLLFGLFAVSRSSYGQAPEVWVSGSNFNIKLNALDAIQFQHEDNKLFKIEVLTGTLNGTDCTLGVTETYGTLTFHSQTNCSFELTQNHDELMMRIECTGFPLSPIVMGHSWNGTFSTGQTVYMLWSWNELMIHEQYWNFLLGIAGAGLIMFGVTFMSWSIKKYRFGFMDSDKTYALPVGIISLLIGFGLVVMWLWP
jgi:hypothetical protein